MSLKESRNKDHLVGTPRGREPTNPYRSPERASEMGKAREYASKCGAVIEEQFIRIQQGLVRVDDQQRALLESAYTEIRGELSFTQNRTFASWELDEIYTKLGEPSTSIFEEGSKKPKNEALKNLFQTLDEIYGINLMKLHEEIGRDGELPAPIKGEISPYVGYLIRTALVLTRETLNPTPLILSEKTRWFPNLFARDEKGRAVTQVDAALVDPNLEEKLSRNHSDLEELLRAVRAEKNATWEMVEIRLLLRSRYNTGPERGKLKKPLRRDLRGIQERLGLLALWWCSGRRKIFPFPEVCRLIYVRSPSSRCHTFPFDAAFFEEWLEGLQTKHQIFSDQIDQFKEKGQMSDEEFLEAVRLERELTESEAKLNQALEELEMSEEKLVESGKWNEEGPYQEAFNLSLTKSFLEDNLIEILGKRGIYRQELTTITDAERKKNEISRLIDILKRAQETARLREGRRSRERRKRLRRLEGKETKGEEVVLFQRPPLAEQEKPQKPKPVQKKRKKQPTQGELFMREETS